MPEEIVVKCLLCLGAVNLKEGFFFDLYKGKRFGNITASGEFFNLCFKQGAGHRGHPPSLECTHLYAGREEDPPQ